MYTSMDKALVALIMAIIYLINNTTSFHIWLTEDQLNNLIVTLTPLAVYFFPNKSNVK